MGELNNTEDNITQPNTTDTTTAANRIDVILAVFVISYLHLLYTHIKNLNTTLHCVNCPFRAVMLLSLIDMLYLPIIFYLFYRRMRWGWILLFGCKLFTAVPSLEFYFKDYLPRGGAYILSPVLPGIIINIVMLVFMWQQAVTDAFRVNKRVKLMTVTTVAAIYLLVVFGK